MNDRQIILSQNSSNCPISTFKLYISKLTEKEFLFQQPNNKFKHPHDQWYKKLPVGVNQIAKFLAEISQKAGLSYIDTNHCLRGTTATTMDKAGYSLMEIYFVTKYKNIVSEKILSKTYNGRLKILAQICSNTQATPQTVTVTEPHTPKHQAKSKQKSYKKSKKDNPTKHETQGQLVAITNSQNDCLLSPQKSTQNAMAMYKQNLIGMFIGANLTNCTININKPK